MKRTMFLMFIITLLLTSQICQAGGDMRLSLEEIKKAADQELIKQGYEPSKMNVVYNEDNSYWYTASLIKTVEATPDLKTEVKGHDYIVLLYSRKLHKGKRIAGGAAYVFVDRNTGEILLFLSGK